MGRKWLSEFIGTFILVFAGTGAVVVDQITGKLTHIGVSLTFGLVVVVLIYTFGHISGAHFNPAVTIGFLIRKELSLQQGIFYILSQFLGAIAASGTLYFLFGKMANLGATVSRFSWQQAFVIEFILTWILMTIILGSAIHEKAIKSFAGVAIGATIGLEAMFAGPISGASMNPARSFGPALISGVWEYQWIYFAAPILGAIFAVMIFRFL